MAAPGAGPTHYWGRDPCHYYQQQCCGLARLKSCSSPTCRRPAFRTGPSFTGWIGPVGPVGFPERMPESRFPGFRRAFTETLRRVGRPTNGVLNTFVLKKCIASHASFRPPSPAHGNFCASLALLVRVCPRMPPDIRFCLCGLLSGSIWSIWATSGTACHSQPRASPDSHVSGTSKAPFRKKPSKRCNSQPQFFVTRNFSTTNSGLVLWLNFPN